MIAIFMGPPGSGKGTQAIKLANKTGLPHIAVGDMLREAVAQKSQLGQLAKSFMDQGQLVPDELTIELVKERLSKRDCENGFILDGFPRSEIQANALEEVLEDLDYKVVYINVELEEVIKRNSNRLSCRNCNAVYNLLNNPPKKENVCDICGGELYQRSDDNPEVIKNRFDVYNQNTKPLVEFYASKGKLLEVSGEGDIDEVFNRLVSALHIE